MHQLMTKLSDLQIHRSIEAGIKVLHASTYALIISVCESGQAIETGQPGKPAFTQYLKKWLKSQVMAV